MAKKSVVPEEVNPSMVPEILETLELLDKPQGVQRVEMVKAVNGKVYFRCYYKSLTIPNFVSISYSSLKKATEAKDAYLETGKIDWYEPKDVKKKGNKQ
jgi:hypothetical protein